MKTILAAALILSPALADAQATPSQPGTQAAERAAPAGAASGPSQAGGLLGQLGGLLGGGGTAGALPQIGAIGAGNAAGLLGYCVKNRLLGTGGTTGAASVLGRLTGQRDVQSQPGYAAGQAGQVQAPNGQALSLGALRGQVKNQVCNLVLNRAKAFL
jgi:hypothetical protein